MAETELRISEIASSKKLVVKPRQALPTPSAGLFLQDDTTPTSSTLASTAGFIDDDLETPVAVTFSDDWSIGIDLGSAKYVSRLVLFDDGSNDQGLYYLGTNDSLELYTSADNSSWTRQLTIKNPVREIYLEYGNYPSPEPSPLPSPLPFTQVTDPIYMINIIPTDPISARYFKLHAHKGGLKDISGNLLAMTEIQAWQQPDLTKQQVSRYALHKILSEVDASPPMGAGDGDNDTEIIFTRGEGA